MSNGQPLRAQQIFRRGQRHHADGVGAFERSHRLACRRKQVAGLTEMVVNQVRDDFGIGLGFEVIPEALQVRALFLVVLDDAVVHHRDFVARDDRMGVELGDAAVRGPARVADADGAAEVFAPAPRPPSRPPGPTRRTRLRPPFRMAMPAES